MSNCSKCGMPLEASEAQCLYCGEVIHAGATPAEEDGGTPVPIATFVSMEEAEACKAKLAAAGVNAMLDSGAAGGPWGQSNGPQQVQLWVRDVDAAQAQAIITDAEPVPSGEPVDDLDENAFADAPVGPSSLPPEPPPPRNADGPADNVRSLESKLSALMDDKDVPGWTVNPAYHPDVLAFIEAHARNAAFVKKAKALQENRASYYTKMRSQAPAEDQPVEAAAEAEFADAGDDDNVPNLEDVVGTRRGPAIAVATRRAARAKSPRRRGRLLTLVLVLVGVPAAVVVASSFYFQKVGRQKLTAAVAAADAKGPWHWDDLKSPEPAEGEANGSNLVKAQLAKRFEKTDVKAAFPVADLFKLEPNVPLTPDQVKLLEPISKKLVKLEYPRNSNKFVRPMAMALRLEGPLVHSFVKRTVDEVVDQPSSFPDFEAVTDVMLLDSALRAQNGETGPALILAREALGVSRCIGDEPTIAAQKFRVLVRRRAVAAVERALAFGEPPPDELIKTQRMFLEESEAPILAYAAKGQRAIADELMTRLESNPASLKPDDEKVKKAYHLAGPSSAVAPLEHWLKLGWIMENHGRSLDLFNRLVAVAETPEGELFQTEKPGDGPTFGPESGGVLPAGQVLRFREFEQAMREMEGSSRTALARLDLKEIAAFARDCLESKAELRVAAAALAIERFRQANDRWPDKIEDLQRDPPIPVGDPCDGLPLRLRKFDGGLMVYSVGLDGKDNEGQFDRADPNKPDTDVVFRIWDVARRGK